MPNVWNGFVTYQKFKADIQLSAILIIFLNGKVEQFEESFELSGAVYVLKPFNQKEFIVRIQFHLKMRSLVNELQQAKYRPEHKTLLIQIKNSTTLSTRESY
jgi:DNA-binding response OmpR family regulator